MKTHWRCARLRSRLAGGLALLGFVTACTTVPITQRQSLQLVPDAELTALSLQEYQKVLRQAQVARDGAQVQAVRRVGQRIARAAEAFLQEQGYGARIRELHWEFNLIEDEKTANAWVMPGGKAAVYTGILKYTQDDTGLAVVLGHEVAHAIAGHGNERMSQGLMAEMGAVALSVALSQEPAATQNLFMQAYGLSANVGLLLPYSRLHENEADRIGLILMARAGYDPRQAIPFWQRMQSEAGRRPPELLSTHPAPQSRIDAIRRELPEALRYFRGA